MLVATSRAVDDPHEAPPNGPGAAKPVRRFHREGDILAHSSTTHDRPFAASLDWRHRRARGHWRRRPPMRPRRADRGAPGAMPAAGTTMPRCVVPRCVPARGCESPRSPGVRPPDGPSKRPRSDRPSAWFQLAGRRDARFHGVVPALLFDSLGEPCRHRRDHPRVCDVHKYRPLDWLRSPHEFCQHRPSAPDPAGDT
jgi:hypothetical protein